MKRSVLSPSDSLDFDARELARAAARQAGLNLEDWVAAILRDKTESAPLAQRRQASDGADLGIARSAKGAMPSLGRDEGSFSTSLTAERESQAREHASRTAIALESMATWIEQADRRLNEATRKASDHQDRLTSALSQALSTLKDRLDSVERDVACERLAQPGATITPLVESIRTDIEDLRAAMAGLATREEIAALDETVRALVGKLSKGGSAQDLLILAQSISALYKRVQTLSDDLAEGVQRRIGGEIDLLKRRIDEAARSGIDRSVIDFLSSQIVDMRQDLAQRAEPQQIARLSDHVETLGRQIAEMRAAHMDRKDVSALKDSLERICVALDKTVAAQEASDVPEQLQRVSRRLDELAARPQPKPVDMEPITAQLALMTERMASLSSDRLEQTNALSALIERLSAQLDAVSEAGDLAPEKAASIAEHAARSAVRDLEARLPDPDDMDVLKKGFSELKALQVRADAKTQQTLRAVHEALESLVARFPDQVEASRMAEPNSSPALTENLPPADRLEAAVRRLHAAAIAQLEEVAATAEGAPEAAPGGERRSGPDRADFIAAARRAAKTQDQAEDAQETETPPKTDHEAAEQTAFPPALIERLRQAFETHRRPFLIGLAVLLLAAGTPQILSNAYRTAPGQPTEPKTHDLRQENVEKAAEKTGSIAPTQNLFQASSLTTMGSPATATAKAPPKFVVDPQTIGALPAELPASLRQAALAGDAMALYEIASRAAEGREMTQDVALAARLYERAAQAGLPPAQERFAMLLDKGVGLPRDSKAATTWYERAAQGGNVRAMHNLATLLASGVNGKTDYEAALRWYTEAAEAGMRDSQFNLGVLFARGIGTRQDLQKAYKWFAIAAAQGDAEAAKKRDEIATRLGPNEITVLKESAEQWRPRSVDPIANGNAFTPQGQTAALERSRGGRS